MNELIIEKPVTNKQKMEFYVKNHCKDAIEAKIAWVFFKHATVIFKKLSR